MRNNKVLSILVVVLVILNIFTLSYFSFFKKKPSKGKNESFVSMMKKDLNLTPDQVTTIEAIRKNSKDKIEKTIDSMRFYKDSIYLLSLNHELSDSTFIHLFDKVGKLRTVLEFSFFKQSAEVRKLLTPEQIVKFDSINKKRIMQRRQPKN